MRPEPSHDEAYEADEEPTIPRARAPKLSGVRPAATADDASLFDGCEADTDVDAQTLSADEEPTTAHYPSDVEQILVGISKLGGDDTATAPTIKKGGRG